MACYFPYNVANPLYGMSGQPARIPVPCGRCPDCVKRRVNEWSFRLQQEERNYMQCYFVTLTYEAPPLSANGMMTLDKKHVQDYWQRIRMSFAKRVPSEKKGRWKWDYSDVPTFKYYVIGEYGSKFQRPHYHAIIFGLDVDTIAKNWEGHITYDSISGESDSVVLGAVHTGTVTGASIGYTLKYMAKGKLVPAHSRDDREPEFAMMSKRIGANYLDTQTVKHHRKLKKVHLTNPDGFTISMPRYYREKIWTKLERHKLAEETAAHHQALEEKRQAAYKKRTGSMDGYDRSKHEAKKASITNFRRNASSKRKDL